VSGVYLALGFLATAALVSTLAARARLPYSTALVVVGLMAGTLRFAPTITIRPEAIVAGLIVPLLFEGAIRLPRAHLRAYAPLIVALAVPGTAVSAAAVAAAALLGHAGMRAALLTGAVCAAIDPAGVIAMAREAGLEERLGTVLEGEAVLNDAVAIILFTLAAEPAAPAAVAAEFFRLLAAGVVIGGLTGAAVAYALGGVTDPVIEAIGSLVAAAGAYAASQAAGGSGVIGVVAAGVTFAALSGRSLTPAGSETLRAVWDVIAFLANSALFLLIGVVVPPGLLVRHAGFTGLLIAAALVSRALIVYGFAGLLARPGAPFPAAWRHVLIWGGLRGGVAVALVLALPADLANRTTVAAGILGLVVWTLIVQSPLMRPVMRWAGLARGLRPPRRRGGPVRSV
jgi:CPA1 family monovalent cation:H+ antiporter